MRCETCARSGRPGYLAVRVRSRHDGFAVLWAPCPDCIGGVASCCDAAGAAQPDPQRRAVMPDEPEMIIFKGFDHGPGDAEAATKAARNLRAVLVAALEPGGPLAGLDGHAVLDGLITLWLDLSLRAAGVARTGALLRRLRRDLPRMAAAQRAAARQACPRESGGPDVLGEPEAGHA